MTLLAAALVAAGCGSDRDEASTEGKAAATPAAKPVGKESQGSVVQYADCGDWLKGTRAEKEATIDVLRGQLTPQRSKTAASPLSDERAFGILEKTCTESGIASLRLYKLYARAQGFAPLAGI